MREEGVQEKAVLQEGSVEVLVLPVFSLILLTIEKRTLSLGLARNTNE